MNAFICDFCGTTIRDPKGERMIYAVLIDVTENYVAETKAEKSLLFEAEHVCVDSTELARAVLQQLKTIKGRGWAAQRLRR